MRRTLAADISIRPLPFQAAGASGKQTARPLFTWRTLVAIDDRCMQVDKGGSLWTTRLENIIDPHSQTSGRSTTLNTTSQRIEQSWIVGLLKAPWIGSTRTAVHLIPRVPLHMPQRATHRMVGDTFGQCWLVYLHSRHSMAVADLTTAG